MISRNGVFIKGHRGVEGFRRQSQVEYIMDRKGSDDMFLQLDGQSMKQISKTKTTEWSA